MKNILLFVACFCPLYIFGQSVIETTIYDYNAIVQSVSKNSAGQYLVSSTENLIYNTSYVSLHDIDGTLLWREKVCDCRYPIVSSIEMNDGNLLHFIQDGKIYQTNAVGKELFLVHDILENEPFIRFLYEVVEYENIAYVFAWVSSGESTQSIILTFDLGDVSTFSYSYSMEEHAVRKILFLNDEGRLLLFSDGTIRKLDSNDNVVWEKKGIPISNERTAGVYDLTTDNEGKLYACGSVISEDNPQNFNAVIMSLNGDGTIGWSREFPHRTLCNREGITCPYSLEHIEITGNGNILAVGGFGFSGEELIYPVSSISIIETDISGNVLWTAEDLLPLSFNLTEALFPTEGNGFYVFGTTGISDAPSGERVFLIKLDTQTSTIEIPELAATLYPNPSVEYLQIEVPASIGEFTVELFDSKGRLVQRSENNSRIYIGALAQGIYTARISSDTAQKNFQWVKM